jgi:hypothetical protein
MMILACGACGGILESGMLPLIIPAICGVFGFCVRCITKKKEDKPDCDCDCHEENE